MGRRDWAKWHESYDDPSSALAHRLAIVQELLRAELDHLRGGPARLLSLCAGQGRDVIDVLARHPRGVDVTARLVELDHRNVAAACARAAAAGLHGVEVLEADAGETDACAGAVPAEVVLVCGVFGNVSDDDIARTVSCLAQLCAPRALVIWTRHRYPPDVTPAIREWLAMAGFIEEAFVAVDGSLMSVGAHRLVGTPQQLTRGQRLFSFVGYDRLLGGSQARDS
ncbi:MAG TPA: class I SAM-dependent methyltransferase family protein [Acidimicrobiales bacterium]|nr:class I SAM-dependent methyltransferase family protein [Acidimicrobiales bacterium]